MNQNLMKRRALLFWLNAAQLVCLLVGLLFFANWLELRIGQVFRRQVLSDNHHASEQMAALIRQMNIQDVRAGSPDWARLQSVIERTSLPNNGFICVVDAADGGMLCHPGLAMRPNLRDLSPGRAVLEGFGSNQPIIDAARRHPTGSGWIKMEDGTHLVGVSSVPELGVLVMAHQREGAMLLAVASIVSPLRWVGVLVALGLTGFTTLLTWTVVRRYENDLARVNANLEQLVDQRSRALVKTRDAVIFGLATLAESRDGETGEHLERVHDYVKALATELAKERDDLDEETISTVALASSLHDIGKVGVPDAVLLKKGGLSPEERSIIEKHPLIGGDCLLALKQRLGEDDFLTTAWEIAFAHHEQWDGSGYPSGLGGKHIPLAARIVAVADMYDALTSKRVYKESMTHEAARDYLTERSGTHLDPEIVSAFLRIEQTFADIMAKPRSGSPALQTNV